MAEEDRSGQRDWGGNTSALGGYGSAGLFSRRRQMERTTGGSYENLSDISSAQAPGGYARMPTTGPSPVIRGVEYAPSQPASGPKAMAQFVKPNFNRAGPKEVVPTGNFEKFLTRVGALAPLRQEEEEAEPEAPVEVPRPQLALPSAGRPMGTGEEGPLAIGPAPTPYGAIPRGGRTKSKSQLAVIPQDETPTWDPTMTAPIRTGGTMRGTPALPSAVEGPRPVSAPPSGAIFATSRRRGRSTVGTESEPREMPETFEYPYAEPPIKNRKRKNRPGPGQFSLGLD